MLSVCSGKIVKGSIGRNESELISVFAEFFHFVGLSCSQRQINRNIKFFCIREG